MRKSAVVAFYRLLCLAVLFCWQYTSIMAQSTQELFGKNRVQYKQMSWFYYESANFTTYYSTGGSPLARFVVQSAEKDLEEIKQVLEYAYSGKMEILVFGDLSDFNQSNVGYEQGEESYNIGGVTKVIGNKIFVYFDGDHAHLNIQIRQGIAKILMDNILFGSTIQEVVQNAVLLNLPDWYVDGLVAYIAAPWSTSDDNRLRDLFNNESIKSFSDLKALDATFTGLSFWNFVHEKFDAGTIANLLYITRINRSMESGFLFVLGKGVNESYNEWFQFYKERYAAELKNRKRPADKYLVATNTSKKYNLSAAKISADGKYIAYSTNELGQIRVVVQELEKRGKRILKLGLKNTLLPVDAQNPVFTWDYSGKVLYVFYIKRKVNYCLTYQTDTKKKQTIRMEAFNKIIEASWGPDKSTLLLTAIKSAYSDIYLFNPQSGKTTAITDDLWDDKQAHVVSLNGKRGVVFASNRQKDSLRKQTQDTTLQVKAYDVFFYNLNSKSLTRIYATPLFEESLPMQYNRQLLCFISNANGIHNRYYALLDSVYKRTDTLVYFKDSVVTNPRYTNRDSLKTVPNSLVDSIHLQAIYKDTFQLYPATNYAYNIDYQEIAPKGKFVLESLFENGRRVYYRIPVKDSVVLKEKMVLNNSTFRKRSLKPEDKQKVELITNENTAPDIAPLPSDSTLHNKTFRAVFQSEFVMPWDTNAFYLKDTVTRFVKEPVFKQTRVIPYRAKMYTTEIYSKLDKGTLFNHIYQPFNGTPSYDVPPISMWTGIDVKDILEDHVISGAFNIPSNIGSLALYLRYSNYKKRLDKQFTYYRNSQSNINILSNLLGLNDNSYKVRYKTNYFEGKYTYPIDEFRHFSAYTAARIDRYDLLSSDVASLQTDKYQEDWGIGRLEYIHDNTRKIGLNILNGTRYKVFGEYQRLFTTKGYYFGFVGLDFRHYTKVYRSMIWANRLAMSSSFGTAKMLYYLGGVDAWWSLSNNKFNTANPVNNPSAYGFQSLATNLRGFRYNARNGSNYFVINSELRIPVFAILSKNPIRSEFFKNFQFIPFADIGSAWVGPSPLSDKARLSFTDVIVKEPVTIEVNYFRNPIISGYGFGFRTLLFGYFLRLDYAWGVDNGQVQSRVTYLSATTDF